MAIPNLSNSDNLSNLVLTHVQKGLLMIALKKKQEAAVQTEEFIGLYSGQNCEEEANIAVLPIFFISSRDVITAHVVCVSKSPAVAIQVLISWWEEWKRLQKCH